MASQTLNDIVRQIKEAVEVVMKRQKVGIGQAAISGALTGGMTPHASHPFPSLDPGPVDSYTAQECDAWADQAEDANTYSNNWPPEN